MAKEPIFGMENITEAEVFWKLRPEHRGRRTALFQLLSNVMFVKDDYNSDSLAEKLFFETKTLADKVLEYLVKSYNFTRKKLKEIIIYQPRYPSNEVMNITDYINQNNNCDVRQFYEESMAVVIVDASSKFEIAIWG